MPDQITVTFIDASGYDTIATGDDFDVPLPSGVLGMIVDTSTPSGFSVVQMDYVLAFVTGRIGTAFSIAGWEDIASYDDTVNCYAKSYELDADVPATVTVHRFEESITDINGELYEGVSVRMVAYRIRISNFVETEAEDWFLTASWSLSTVDDPDYALIDPGDPTLKEGTPSWPGGMDKPDNSIDESPGGSSTVYAWFLAACIRSYPIWRGDYPDGDPTVIWQVQRDAPAPGPTCSVSPQVGSLALTSRVSEPDTGDRYFLAHVFDTLPELDADPVVIYDVSLAYPTPQSGSHTFGASPPAVPFPMQYQDYASLRLCVIQLSYSMPAGEPPAPVSRPVRRRQLSSREFTIRRGPQATP